MESIIKELWHGNIVPQEGVALRLKCEPRFATRRWVLHLPTKKGAPREGRSLFVAEGVGFEPTWACTQTVFKTASL